MTECYRCGDCCDPVKLSPAATSVLEGLFAGTNTRPVLDGQFFLDHWALVDVLPDGRTRWACLAFNPDTRECDAHDDRPHVCSGFPWYGRAPEEGKLDGLERCSFRVDLGMPTIGAPA